MRWRINFPKNICELADKFREQRLEEKRVKERRRRVAEKARRCVRAWRLKNGLPYAKKIFRWANSFRKSRVGRELMRKSHVPYGYPNIVFFDGHVEGTNWAKLVASPKELSINRGGRWSAFTGQVVKSPSDLAKSVDTKILREACEWIDTGKVWECIERRFDYLKKQEAK